MLHIDNPTPAQVLMLRAERSAHRWHVALLVTIVAVSVTFTAWLADAPNWAELGLLGVTVAVLGVASVFNRAYRADLARICDLIEQERAASAVQG
ncbi:hypothetical protein [Catellatospora sp. NPDC049609]|uniref:hypothetical protein n=1 Tax=Catellatospora sp. NPDC049609 TaxID=3155505 RepID=UPI00343E9DD6